MGACCLSVVVGFEMNQIRGLLSIRDAKPSRAPFPLIYKRTTAFSVNWLSHLESDDYEWGQGDIPIPLRYKIYNKAGILNIYTRFFYHLVSGMTREREVAAQREID